MMKRISCWVQRGFLLLASRIKHPERLFKSIEASQLDDDDCLDKQKSLCALAAVNEDFDTTLHALEAIINIAPQFNDQFARRSLPWLSLLLKARTDSQSVVLFKQARRVLVSCPH